MKNTAALLDIPKCDHCDRMRLELANKKAMAAIAGAYRVSPAVLRDLARVHFEITKGVNDRGARLLADLLEELDPRWRDL